MVLIENFNTSNQTSPIALEHFMFVIDIKVKGCELVQEISFEQRCQFVKNTADCHQEFEFVNYLELLYCTMKVDSNIQMYSSLILLLLFCVYMFMIMGTCADKFFVPALTMLSKMMGMSENVAGVTILAFGNGSPDLFTSFSHIDGETTMLYSELVGAATFVTSVVAGAIIVVKPFKLFAPHFLRDGLFFLAAIQLVDYAMLSQGTVNLYESIAILFIYVTYLVVVIIDQVLANKMVQTQVAGSEKYKDQATLDFVSKKSTVSVTFDDYAMAAFTGSTANEKLFQQFFMSLNPIDMEEWTEGGWLMKTLMIIKAPVVFLLILIIPVVDYEVEAHGWSKLLDCLHIIIIPFILTAVGAPKKTFHHIPMYMFVALCTLPIAIVAFFTSRTDRPPKYHIIFDVLAITGSVFIIWLSASEVVHVLEAIGAISKLSTSFLGCSVLAWGNSIGDLIANMALARQGYQKMGFAGCYGGPLFNTLIAMGVTFLYKCVMSKNHEAIVRRGYMAENCSIFLSIVLLFTILATGFTNFVARRSIGIFLLILYGMFMCFVLLSELEIIHAFGTDHV